MGVQNLIIKVLFLVIVCLLGLQYLSLLQVNEKRHLRNRSLFTLDWSGFSNNRDSSASGGRRASPLLGSIEEYLKGGDLAGGAGGKDDDLWNKTHILVPPTVTSTTTTTSSERGINLKSNHVVNSYSKKNSVTTSIISTSSSESSSTKANTSSSTSLTAADDVAPLQVPVSETSLLPLCPMIPPGLRGPIKVTLPADVPSTMGEIEAQFPHLSPGGRSQPSNCSSRHRVAIIVPYRDRELHLRTFLLNIHAFLEKQMLDYGIFIVEQFGPPSSSFNRAMLMNVGASEALKQHDFHCFVFHDVDLLPEDDRNLYTCPVQPRHMSVAIDSFLYRLPYDDIFGGVSAMSVDHFRQVNGFSNIFWGWGGEDDDMSNRLRQKKLYISRYPANIARYKMLRHNKGKANPDRFRNLYSGAKRMTRDGYNSLKYKRINMVLKKLYTWILVDLAHLKH